MFEKHTNFFFHFVVDFNTVEVSWADNSYFCHKGRPLTLPATTRSQGDKAANTTAGLTIELVVRNCFVRYERINLEHIYLQGFTESALRPIQSESNDTLMSCHVMSPCIAILSRPLIGQQRSHNRCWPMRGQEMFSKKNVCQIVKF